MGRKCSWARYVRRRRMEDMARDWLIALGILCLFVVAIGGFGMVLRM